MLGWCEKHKINQICCSFSNINSIKDSTETISLLLDLTVLIDFCKNEPLLDLMSATHLKQAGAEVKKDWESRGKPQKHQSGTFLRLTGLSVTGGNMIMLKGSNVSMQGQSEVKHMTVYMI